MDIAAMEDKRQQIVSSIAPHFESFRWVIFLSCWFVRRHQIFSSYLLFTTIPTSLPPSMQKKSIFDMKRLVWTWVWEIQSQVLLQQILIVSKSTTASVQSEGWWVLECFLRLQFHLKVLSQWLHLNGLSPVCMHHHFCK